MNQIPEKIHLFNAYKDGVRLIGLTDEVTLPDLETMTETISGPGILGEVDSPTPGHFGSMEQEMPFRNLDENLFGLFTVGERVQITLRASQQYQTIGGKVDYKGLRIVEGGIVKGIGGGSLKQGSPMGSSIKLEITYYLVELNGKKLLELDKFNGIFVVNGVDIMEKSRSLC